MWLKTQLVEVPCQHLRSNPLLRLNYSNLFLSRNLLKIFIAFSVPLTTVEIPFELHQTVTHSKKTVLFIWTRSKESLKTYSVMDPLVH